MADTNTNTSTGQPRYVEASVGRFREKKLQEELFEAEYARRKALPADKDRVWYSYSRASVEKVMEEEGGGEGRNKDGSKHCRICFGYGTTIARDVDGTLIPGDMCTHCVSFPSGVVKKYVGHNQFVEPWE